MEKVFKSFVENTVEEKHKKMLSEFLRREKNKIYRIQNNSKNKEQIEKYIFQQVLVFFSDKAKAEEKDKEVIIRYIDKTR